MNDNAAPLVTVVIPTYNHSCYLGRALQSVLDQTYTNWEAIVIDNHSTDNTDEVMASFADHRITYLKIHNNGVIAASRNAGIRSAKGEWIAFLDSDDWWELTKLKRSVDAIELGADLVYHDLFIVRSCDQLEFKERIVSSKPIFPLYGALLCEGMSVPNSSVVVRKELLNRIGGISEKRELISVEDYDTWVRIARLSEKFVRLSVCLGYYWMGGGNISSASPIQITRIKTLYDQYLDELTSAEQQQAEGFLAYRIGRIAQLCGEREIAKKNFKAALRKPINFKYRVKALYLLLKMR